MPFTLGQAAIQTGKSKPTILKALKSGRMSGEKVGNEWQIDPAELFRVYPKATAVNPTETPPAFHSVNPTETPLTETSIDLLTLRLKLEAAEQQIEALKDDRDQWRQVANRLLSAPPQAAAQAAPARGPRGFFGRFFRGS